VFKHKTGILKSVTAKKETKAYSKYSCSLPRSFLLVNSMPMLGASLIQSVNTLFSVITYLYTTFDKIVEELFYTRYSNLSHYLWFVGYLFIFVELNYLGTTVYSNHLI
jgi:hypothetical protein